MAKRKRRVDRKKGPLDWEKASVIISGIALLVSVGSLYSAARANSAAQEANGIAQLANEIAERASLPNLSVDSRRSATSLSLIGCTHQLHGQAHYNLWIQTRFPVLFTNNGGLAASLVSVHLSDDKEPPQFNSDHTTGFWLHPSGSWARSSGSLVFKPFIGQPDNIPAGTSVDREFLAMKLLATTHRVTEIEQRVRRADLEIPSEIGWEFSFGSGEVLRINQDVFRLEGRDPEFTKECRCMAGTDYVTEHGYEACVPVLSDELY